MHQVIDSIQAIVATIGQLVQKYAVELIVMGNGTTSKNWQQQIESNLASVGVITVNEANSTLEARESLLADVFPQRTTAFNSPKSTYSSSSCR